MLLQFEVPRTKSIQFEDFFKTITHEGLSNLRQASLARDEIVQSLKNNSPPAALVAVIEKYIPYLISIIEIIQNNPKLKLKGHMKFSWTFVFSETEKSLISDSIFFEAVMVHLTLAIVRSNTAADKLNTIRGDSGIEDAVKIASNELRIASGIASYVVTQLYPKWLDLPKRRPPDILPGLAQSLSDMFAAEAQKLAVKMAEHKGTSDILVGKLAVASYRRFDAAFKAIKVFPEQDYQDTWVDYRMWLQMEQALVRSIAMKHFGIHYFSDKVKEYGVGLGFMRLSAKQMSEIMQRRHLAFKLNSEEITHVGNEIESKGKQYQHENDFIYGNKKIEHEDLEQRIPEGRTVVDTIVYTPPNSAFRDPYQKTSEEKNVIP